MIVSSLINCDLSLKNINKNSDVKMINSKNNYIKCELNKKCNSYKMNREKAQSILNLNYNYTKKELKKAYHKKCLEYHPDKNTSDIDKFRECKDAFEFLSNDNFSNNFVDFICKKYDIDYDIIMEFINETSDTLLLKMDNELKINLYKFLTNYYYIFGISLESLKEKFNIKNKEKYIISTTLEDLFDKKIYILENKSKDNKIIKTYVPLWHKELLYDNFIVYVIPELPKNIKIDFLNNIHISLNIDNKLLFKEKKYTIKISENKSISINLEELYCKRSQIKILHKMGIPKIYCNKKNIFDIDELSDIFLYITIN